MAMHRTIRFRSGETGRWAQLIFAPVQTLLIERIVYYDGPESATVIQDWHELPIDIIPLQVGLNVNSKNAEKCFRYMLGMMPSLQCVETLEEKKDLFLIKSESDAEFLARTQRYMQRTRFNIR